MKALSSLFTLIFCITASLSAKADWLCQAECSAYTPTSGLPRNLGAAIGVNGQSRTLAFAELINDCEQLMEYESLGNWDMYLNTYLRAEHETESESQHASSSWGGSSGSMGMAGHSRRGLFVSRSSIAVAGSFSQISGGSSHSYNHDRDKKVIEVLHARAVNVCSEEKDKLDTPEFRYEFQRLRQKYRGPGTPLGG